MRTPSPNDIMGTLRTSAVGVMALALQDGDEDQALLLACEADPAYVVEVVRILNEVGIELHGEQEWRGRCHLVAAEGDVLRARLARSTEGGDDA